MRSLKRQRGIGWFGLLFIFAVIGFTALCVIKITPLYLNELTIQKDVKATASDPVMGQADISTIRGSLQRRWDVDYAQTLEPKDIKIRRDGDKGRVLFYDYEARVNLFYNVYVVVQFAKEFPMANSANAQY